MHDIATDSRSCDKKATHRTEIEKFIVMLSPNSALLTLQNEIGMIETSDTWIEVHVLSDFWKAWV